MRVLLDECIPESITSLVVEHEAKHVADMGWRGLKNGELLALAELQFDVLLTTDRNLPYQQNLPKYEIAVLIIATLSNKHEDIAQIMPDALRIIPALLPGQLSRVP